MEINKQFRNNTNIVKNKIISPTKIIIICIKFKIIAMFRVVVEITIKLKFMFHEEKDIKLS